MAIQSPRSNTRLFSNVVEAGIRTRAGKRLLCNLKNAVAVAPRVGARFSRGNFLSLGRHKKSCNRRTSPVILSTDSETLSVLIETGRPVNSASFFRLGKVRNMNPLE